MFSSSRSAASKWGWLARTVTGVALTVKATRRSVWEPKSIAVTGFTLQQLLYKMLSNGPRSGSIENRTTLISDSGIHLGTTIFVKIKQGFFVLLAPVQVANCRNQLVARGDCLGKDLS